MAARNGTAKVSGDDCFFGRNGLCALALDEPCATFRPDHPEGLRPPSQLRFVFRENAAGCPQGGHNGSKGMGRGRCIVNWHSSSLPEGLQPTA